MKTSAHGHASRAPRTRWAIPPRLTGLRVVPKVNRFVEFGYRIGPDKKPSVGTILIRDTHIAAVTVPDPGPETGLNDLSDDTAAVGEPPRCWQCASSALT